MEGFLYHYTQNGMSINWDIPPYKMDYDNLIYILDRLYRHNDIDFFRFCWVKYGIYHILCKMGFVCREKV